MLLTLDQAAHHACPCCRSTVEKPGYFVIDQANVRQFRCLPHLTALLVVLAEHEQKD